MFNTISLFHVLISVEYKFDMKNITLITWTDHNQSRQQIRLIDEISSKWKTVGDLLGLSTGQINAIEKTAITKCKSVVVKLWLSG